MDIYSFLAVLVFCVALVVSQYSFLKHIRDLERIIKAKDPIELKQIKAVEGLGKNAFTDLIKRVIDKPKPEEVKSISIDQLNWEDFQSLKQNGRK